MAPSRGLRSLARHGFILHSPQLPLCATRNALLCMQPQCCIDPRFPKSRDFTITSVCGSGHSRWSKIKHDKAKVDAGKNKQRSIFAHEIATASKLFGPDANSNPRLADLITKAKREGFAKASIEAAVARGQGRSTSGASLEAVTVEAILPNNIAVIVECETDNKLRTLAEVRLCIKENGGTATPTSYLFTKSGKIVFEKKAGVDLDSILEPALEAGAIDVTEDDDGRLVVWAEPTETRVVGDRLSQNLALDIATTSVSWIPNEDTKVKIADENAATELVGFVDELLEKESSVQSVFLNVARGQLPDSTWQELQSKLDI